MSEFSYPAGFQHQTRGRGRPPGAISKQTREAREFAKQILESQEYRDSLIKRIREGTLPSNIEMLLYHYRFGKPKDVVEFVPASTDQIQGMSNAELAVRAEALARAARAAQFAADAMDAAKKHETTIQ